MLFGKDKFACVKIPVLQLKLYLIRNNLRLVISDYELYEVYGKEFLGLSFQDYKVNCSLTLYTQQITICPSLLVFSSKEHQLCLF